MIQRPKRRCSSMLWSLESMTRHNRSHGHPLHPGLAPDVLMSCLWIQLGQDERVRLIQQRMSPNQQHTFTASTHMQVIQKPYGDGQAAKQQVRNNWKLKLRTCTQAAWFYMVAFLKQYGEFGSRTERLSRPF